MLTRHGFQILGSGWYNNQFCARDIMIEGLIEYRSMPTTATLGWNQIKTIYSLSWFYNTFSQYLVLMIATQQTKSGAVALSYPSPRPLLLLMTLMKKHGWKLYRSPNPDPRGYESAIAPKFSAQNGNINWCFKASKL